MRRKLRFTTCSFTWGLLLSASALFAQERPNLSDSIQVQNLLKKGKEEILSPGGWLSGLSYFADAFRLSQRISYKKGQADALRQMARVEMKTSKGNDQALAYLLDELEIRNQLGDRNEIASTYEMLGDLFYSGAYPDWYQALNYYQQALVIIKDNSSASGFDRITQLYKKIASSYQVLDSLEQELQLRNQLILHLESKPDQKFSELREACQRAIKQELLIPASNYFQQAQRTCGAVSGLPKMKFVRQKCEEDIKMLQKEIEALQKKHHQVWLWNIGLGTLAALLLLGILFMIIRQRARQKKASV